ncbi:RpsU ribosomal protein S21 [Microcystis phage Mel-JY01]
MFDTTYGINPKPINAKVKATEYSSLEYMLKIFKRKVKESGVLEEYKRRTEYIKPSEERKDRINAARKRQRKTEND